MPRFNPRNAVPEDDFDDFDDFDDLGDIDDFDDLDGIDEFAGLDIPVEPAYAPAHRRGPSEDWGRDPRDKDPRARKSFDDPWDDHWGDPHRRQRPSGGRAEPTSRRREPPAPTVRYDRGSEPVRRQDGDDFGHPGSVSAAQNRKRKRLTFGAVIFLLLFALAGAAAYVYFFTDLYYVAAIKMESTDISLFVGESVSVEHEVTSFGSGTPVLSWASTSPQIAEVDEQGNISALSAGSTAITLTDPESGRTAQCAVTVHNVTEMVLDSDSVTLGAGETMPISIHTGVSGTEQPVYVTSDSDIAAVDEAGIITALSPGETDITVSMRGFSDVSCHVTVMAAPTGLVIPTPGDMCAGETRQITVELGEGEHCAVYTYQSDDPAVVTVDEKGLMTAAGEGSATVSVTAYNGQRMDLGVTVNREAGAVVIPEKLTVYSGQPVSLGATDESGSCRQFYYTTSDPEVVQVDENGSVHVLKYGTATITCTSYNGKSAECKISARIVDWQTPYVSDVVYENIAALAATYPELISVESIGKSVQGRDITLLRLGTGERKVLVVAGMHSREGIAVTYTMRCIDELTRAAADGKRYGKYNIKKMLGEYTVYFVPLLNPDGMDIFMGIGQPEYTDQPLTEEELDDFKNTAAGVNLNRNFPFEWGHEKVNVSTPDGRSYAGASAGSEPETQAIIKLCAENEFEWLLDMHCKGHLIYYQDKVTGIVGESNELARKLYKRCGFTLTDQSTKYEISGGLENWFRKEYGKPGICVELVGSQYSTEVNKYFEKKIAWGETKYIFPMCMEDN